MSRRVSARDVTMYRLVVCSLKQRFDVREEAEEARAQAKQNGKRGLIAYLCPVVHSKSARHWHLGRNLSRRDIAWAKWWDTQKPEGWRIGWRRVTVARDEVSVGKVRKARRSARQEFWSVFNMAFPAPTLCSKHRTFEAAERAAADCERRGGAEHSILYVEELARSKNVK